MPSMPARLARPPILHKIDAWIATSIPASAERAISLLEQCTIVEIIEGSRSLGLSEAEKRHLLDDWFDPTGWWPTQQPIEPILRQALIKALQLVVKHEIPMDSYWICAGGDFEAYVAKSGQQVTLMLLTPPPPTWTFEHHPSDIWLARGGLRVGEKLESESDEHVLTVKLLG